MISPVARAKRMAVFLIGALLLSHRPSVLGADSAPSPEQVFQQRILPIFKSPDPSSCTQCHLGSVDLKDYIRPSHKETFLSLRDQGLVDLDRPDDSKILKLINMREPNQGAELIAEKARQAEFAAFSDWIRRSAADPALRSAPKLSQQKLAGPQRPVEVIRHGRKDQLLARFENSIWAMRFRCMSCHIEGSPENDKLRAKHGDQVAWMKKAGPQATMEYLISADVIDLKKPEESLLLLKPLGAVKHGGGKKFLPGDQGYQAFRGWIEDYVKVAGDLYPTAKSLPSDTPDRERFSTDIWLKLASVPDTWGNALLQVDVFAWDASAGAWEQQRLASSDRAIFAKGKLWQHNLTLEAARDSRRAQAWHAGRPMLAPGRYLLKIYVDRRERKARDWQAKLGRDDYVGQIEVQANWPAGYGQMTVADWGKLATE